MSNNNDPDDSNYETRGDQRGADSFFGGKGLPSQSRSSDGGGCFIATAAFGSPLESHVQVLRDFRDEYLLKTRFGKMFVKYYYKFSPPVADVIAKHGMFRSVVRVGLTPIVIFGKNVTRK